MDICICFECHKEIPDGMIFCNLDGKIVCEYCPGFQTHGLKGENALGNLPKGLTIIDENSPKEKRKTFWMWICLVIGPLIDNYKKKYSDE